MPDDDTRENPTGQTPRAATTDTDTAAWLERLSRAEALGRADGIATERARCLKIVRDTNQECDFLVWSDACNTIECRISSGE